jgi:hypothetical protein
MVPMRDLEIVEAAHEPAGIPYAGYCGSGAGWATLAG